jgi:hypothetical protein
MTLVTGCISYPSPEKLLSFCGKLSNMSSFILQKIKDDVLHKSSGHNALVIFFNSEDVESKITYIFSQDGICYSFNYVQ